MKMISTIQVFLFIIGVDLYQVNYRHRHVKGSAHLLLPSIRVTGDEKTLVKGYSNINILQAWMRLCPPSITIKQTISPRKNVYFHNQIQTTGKRRAEIKLTSHLQVVLSLVWAPPQSHFQTLFQKHPTQTTLLMILFLFPLTDFLINLILTL